MRAEEFNELRRDLIKKCISITDTKGKDYTKGDLDVLKAFKEGGSFFDVSSKKYLGFALLKHFNAVFNYIKTDGQSESEPIEDRLADIINYSILLHALIKDEDKKSVE